MIKLLLKLTGCICLLMALGLSLSGCSNQTLADLQEEETLATTLIAKQSKSKKGKLNFTTHLSGDNEVPAKETKATGQVIVRVSKDESSVYFKLIVANVQTNISGSHFHMAPAGTNGGVVVNLLNASDFTPQTEAPVNGVLAEGTITESNLAGDFAGNPLSDLISAIRAGNIYINVHTDKYGSGELRGQL
ncbi:CHRD domain-containing protein [Algibacter luteus]|uniref:CHRD domain-containing protein n=1 Tax=Algibacter luteus TaxID=1178825 RepID=A0A1M6AQN4_9FLAO|nr:CHRD domain-containing protein [Algibacter luteus]WJJ97401.1 CHRD domain-containing protein [Algibacter luteus]SHI38810.1 CHRD domain-containing protein [Algibacter luteus]